MKWRNPYTTLMIMMADAPRYISAEEEPATQKKSKTSSTIEILQSKLNNK